MLMAVEGEEALAYFRRRRGLAASVPFPRRAGMKIILIVVVFDFAAGSEPVTAEFKTMAACGAGALAMFEKVDPSSDVAPFELTAGADVIEETMIVRGQDGTAIGMFSCSPLRVGGGKGE